MGVITTPLNDEEKAMMSKAMGWQFEATLQPVDNQNDIDLNLSGKVETRTPSQKLRWAINSLWEKLGSKGDPEVYYREKMRLLIAMVEAKLGEQK